MHFYERFCAFLEFWKFVDFFEIFQNLDPPTNHTVQFFLPGKIISKHVQNMFKQLWEKFWALLVFWKTLECFRKFSKSRTSKIHWAIFFRKKKNSSQLIFKTRLDTFGNVFEHLWHFENSWIFFKLFQVWTLRPYIKHWANFSSKKITSKHVQNMFRHFWERFWAFYGFLKNFRFFPRLDPPLYTGRKKLRDVDDVFLGSIFELFLWFLNFCIFSGCQLLALSTFYSTHKFQSAKLNSYWTDNFKFRNLNSNLSTDFLNSNFFQY